MSATTESAGPLGARRLGDLPVAVSTDGLISVARAGDIDLSLPFFADSVEQLATARAPFRSLDASDFMSAAGAPQPSLFIHHVSRCGSTLLAKAVEVAAPVWMAREPAPLTGVIGPQLDVGSRRPFISAMLWWFEQFAGERGRSLGVKFPSLCGTRAFDLTRAFPSVPSVLVLRHPYRVVASQLRQTSPALKHVLADTRVRSALHAQLSRAGSREVEGVPVAAAAVWAAVVEDFVRIEGHSPITVVHYEDLMDDIPGAVDSVLALCGRPPIPASVRRALTELARHDAKSTVRAAFVPRQGSEQAMLGPRDRYAVDRVIAPALDALASHGATSDY